ncbi:MAG: phosphoenolpyruvate--protein phosphotransferase, partial [Epulopiscium sp.]|nr:phosphoenolpyruvate--protein phosphotransferase [Candidatus Epulonipiscium sp.]
KSIKIYANIGSLEEWELAKQYGAEGIGLFRTEFLYMKNDHFPTEEEQFKIYKKIAQEGGEEIILRTLDIGGDKQLSYYTFPEELNPFLGNRAVRFTLSNIDIFKTQLKAVLRAAVYGNLKVMYPMISSIEELDKANEILAQCKEELEEQNIPYKKDLEVGIMVEIPSTALMVDAFSSKVDFFSIGTNDLCQYTLAVDRMNSLVNHLYQPHHPAVLRLIQQVAKNANQQKKIVGVCGEMAGDSLYTKWLIGVGIHELSMSPTSIPKIKEVIINTTSKECKNIVNQIQPLSNIKKIKNILQTS